MTILQKIYFSVPKVPKKGRGNELPIDGLGCIECDCLRVNTKFLDFLPWNGLMPALIPPLFPGPFSAPSVHALGLAQGPREGRSEYR